MTIDEAAREAALDPWQSFIVEAPAGSGKTALLTRRFLRLLTVVERPESIVAMTFTRKSAAEMRERIHQALIDADSGSAVESDYARRTRTLAEQALVRDRAKGWNLLGDIGQLQIQTIDSLCAMLARQMPVVSQFGGIRSVVEDARELYRLAARNTLRDLTEGSEQEAQLFGRLALHFDNDIEGLEKQIASMLQKRDQWAFLKNQDGDALVNDFCQVLDNARQALRAVFQQMGTVDFSEVAHAARKALGTPAEPTDLLYALDYRIEHLLVDEFQDTSRAQYDLLCALTEQWSEGGEHSLFVVGDPMQSVYRFREAEVALFLQCWVNERLGSVRLKPLRLTSNFRSTPQIVQWVQEKVSPVMAEDNPRLGAVQFRTSQAARTEAGDEPRLIAFIDDNGQKEAAEVVDIVKSTPPGKSIAILARGRQHLTSILPALRRAGIAYRAQEIDALQDEQHIVDLISLTRALLHLGDRVSWLACLRAPWCGLTLADLSALAENEPERAILDLLSDAEKLGTLSSSGRARALRTQEILSDAVASTGHLPLRDLVERTWARLGGPATLQESNQHEDAETFLDLLESLEEGGILRDFSLLEQKLEFFYARPSIEEARVDVMTIHGAKGLEFDTVIIPQIARPTKGPDRDLLVWSDEELAAQPQKSEKDSRYQLICEENGKKEAEEMKRLFYVACTRAKKALYLIGSVCAKKNGQEVQPPRSNTLLGMIWDTVKGQFESELRRRAPVQQSLLWLIEQQAKPETILRRLPADWKATRPEAAVEWKPELERGVASVRKVTYEWVSDASRHVGTVVHELLKRKATGSLPMIEAELLRLGVARSEAAHAAGRVVKAVNATLTSKRGRWILQPHAEAKSEWAISGRIQDKLIHGTIDRKFRDEEGRLWIVDFKTSAHAGGRASDFLDEERRRYQAQLESYATLLSRLEAGPIWLGLYFPLLDGWREWQFAEKPMAAHT